MRTPTRPPFRWMLPLLLALAMLHAGDLAAKKSKAERALPAKYQTWLEQVQYLITEEEKALFLELEKDYQRDAFIERFWKVRDPYPRTGRNELRENYQARLEIANGLFGGVHDDRAKILLLNNAPVTRIEIHCNPYLWPIEVWHYPDGSDTVGWEFLLLFFREFNSGPFKLWDPLLGIDRITAEPNVTADTIRRLCGDKGNAIIAALRWLIAQGGALGAQAVLAEIQKIPEPPQKEWVATFQTYSTDLPPDAATFDAELEIDFPGRRMSRTILQGTVGVPVVALTAAELGDQRAYSLLLTGEILREGKLFESFRYRYDFPAAEVRGDKLPLVFQRYLRPGEYTLIAKVEDVPSGALHRAERVVTVPKVDAAPPPEPDDPETARLLAEANAAIRTGETTIQIVEPRGEWQTGLLRVDTMTTGDGIERVVFLLDDQPILTKKSPPYNVELDLGQVPRPRVLRVEAYDARGEEVANDELMLNTGQHRFAVRLVEPRSNKTYRTSLRAQAEVVVPDGETVERVELYLNETLVATLYQPPYVQPIILPESAAVAYVRAVAYTPDGNATEDLVFINAPDNLEEIEVDFVELYTTVLDKDKRPVGDLGRADFAVYEDGTPQEILRFEQVKNLPIHVAIMLDVSASMETGLPAARGAALEFFRQVVTPKDRAAVVTFNDHPNLATSFTNDVDRLASGLAALKAERGTALWDSLIFTLYYFNGIKGQRAILLLSDGKDESSKFEFDDALEYARRAGVAIYAVGLDLPKRDFGKLERLAAETGGRSFLIDDAAELEAIYDAIQEELRSRYLLAYQSSNTNGDGAFRTIEVELARSGLEAKTLRGYYP